MSAAAMLDPAWTPAAGYSHVAGILEAINRKEQGMAGQRKRPAARRPKRSSNGITAGPHSVKITDRAYRTFERIARHEQRTIVAVIDRAAAHYDAATKGGKLS